MAAINTIQDLPSSTIFTILLIISSNLIPTINSHQFSRQLSKNDLGLKNKIITRLHFYFHDIVSGRNPTAVPIASAPSTNTSSSFFGLLSMMDDPLTMTPDRSSRIVGRAQGMYGSADMKTTALLMVMNFVFTEVSGFSGSTLSVLGRNQVTAALREMPIVGGSRVFRFAQGFAQAKTYWFNSTTGDAVVEYNLTVLHYD